MVWNQGALLHDHLDGSITLLPILQRLFEISGKSYQFSGTAEEQHGAIKRIFENPQIDLVEKFSNTTGVMQTREALTLAAENYVQVRAEQGFTYCEATLAPQYHVFGGLSIPQVVAALIDGIRRGEAKYPLVEVNLLFTVGREVDANEAVRLVDIAGGCDRRYVVGIGLACDEANHPPEKHIKMFARAKELDFKTTCHAGEWVSNCPDYQRDRVALLKNIRTALFDLRVDRLGHAIPLAYDSDLVSHVLKYQIGIEGCPGSNLASHLIPNLQCLRIRELLDAGVLYSLNPDDDLFLPDLNETFTLCNTVYNFTEQEKDKLKMNPWRSRFGKRKTHIEK